MMLCLKGPRQLKSHLATCKQLPFSRQVKDLKEERNHKGALHFPKEAGTYTVQSVGGAAADEGGFASGR